MFSIQQNKKLQKWIKKRKNEITIFIIALFFLDIAIFGHIIQTEIEKDLLKIYFLDVGQGDSALIELPGGARMLVDGGPPNKKVLREITKALSPFERRIDIAAHTHPQLDHFGGIIDILKRYKVNAYVSNGITRDIPSYIALESAIKNHTQKNITLRAGDKIRYGESTIHVLYPTQNAVETEKDPNNSSLVFLIESKGVKTLLTADISKKTEKIIVSTSDVHNIDILKVAHHGSKNSSSKEFLEAAQPNISIIQVGKNSYGHPAPDTLKRLQSIDTQIYRNDHDGTIKITADGSTVKIFTLK